MAQDVRRDAFRRNADGGGSLPDDLEDALPRERAPEPGEEDVRLAGPARKRLAPPVKIGRQRTPRRAAERHDALLRPLADDTQELAVGDDVLQLQGAELAHAQSRAVQNLQHRPVAPLARRIALHCLQHREDLLLREDPRQDLRLPRRVQEFGRVARHETPRLQVAEELADRRRAAEPRRAGVAPLPLVREEGDDVVARDGGSLPLAVRREEARERAQVVPVGGRRVRALPLLERDGREERVDVRAEQ